MAVGLIATGGTIASLSDWTDGAARPAVGADELLRRLGLATEADKVVTRDVARVSGWDVTPTMMLHVAREAQALLAGDEVSGVVVTHGTDTIEETAFLCDLLHRSERPLVLTAAMRSLDEPGTDGPRNLRSALRAARTTGLGTYGALVGMGGAFHAARWVRKVDSRRIDAISSPGRGPLARAAEDAVVFVGPPPPRVTFQIPNELPTVVVVNAYTGAGPDLIETVVTTTDARGLVVEGTGLGNVPEALVAGIQRVLDAGIPVVVASRVLSGGTGAVYGGPGGGASLKSMGVLGAGQLPAGKARLLLSVLLGLGLEGGRLKSSFTSTVEKLR